MKVPIELSESHGITLFHDTHYIQLLSNYYPIIIPLLYHYCTIIIPLFYYCQTHRLYTYHYYLLYQKGISLAYTIITIITIIIIPLLYHKLYPMISPFFCCLFSHSPLLPRTRTAHHGSSGAAVRVLWPSWGSPASTFWMWRAIGG